jgi:hypothetical protein
MAKSMQKSDAIVHQPGLAQVVNENVTAQTYRPGSEIGQKVVNRPAVYIGKPLNKTAVNKDSIEAITYETDRMVTGIFKNLESPGQAARIICRLYKHQQPFSQSFDDGERYTIPYSVARHINENCCYPIHSYLLDDKGQHVKGSGRMVNRYQFTPTEFS